MKPMVSFLDWPGAPAVSEDLLQLARRRVAVRSVITPTCLQVGNLRYSRLKIFANNAAQICRASEELLTK
jgi:hypothetical protein